jgi:hypothetical protein
VHNSDIRIDCVFGFLPMYYLLMVTWCAYLQLICCSLKMHDESTTRSKVEDVQEGAVPPYLLDHDQTQRAKVLILYVLFYSHLRRFSFDECYGIPDCFCFVAL